MNTEMVNPNDLILDDDQPRESLNEDQVEKLVVSMKHKGFRPDKAVTVRRLEDGSLVVKNGAHRVTSAVKVGLQEIPAFIFDVDNTEDESELRLEQLMDNMGLAHTPMEIINTVENALESGANIYDVASTLGKSVKALQDDRCIASLPGAVKKEFDAGNISKTVARKIAEVAMDNVDPIKAMKKATAAGHTASIMIKGIEKYVGEVKTSRAARTKSMFEKDEAAAKTVSKAEKNIVCMFNEKPFTYDHAKKLTDQLERLVNKVMATGLGNGHASAVITANKGQERRVEQLVKSMQTVTKNWTGELENYKLVANG